MKKLLVGLVTLLLSTSAFAGSKEVKKFDRINIDQDRLLVLKGDVRDFTVDPVVNDMVSMNEVDDKARIYLVINTNGGSIEAGMRLVTTMRSIEAPVICLIDSKAYSMGAVIATFCTRTYVHKNASLMFHEASYSVAGPESIIPSRVNATIKYLKQFHSDVAEKLGMSYKQYKRKIANEWWLTPEEAVKAGVAHAIIDKLVYRYEERQQPTFFTIGFDYEITDKPVYIEMK